MILGLDISTSCTGAAFLGADGSIVELTHIELGKVKSFWGKVDVVKEWLDITGHQIDAVYVERSLLRFQQGASSAKTLSRLTRFNGLVSYLAREYYGMDPIFIPVQRARKICGIPIKSKTGSTQKEQAFTYVTETLFPTIPGVPELPLTRTGRVKPYVYDWVDAFIVAKAGLILGDAIEDDMKEP